MPGRVSLYGRMHGLSHAALDALECPIAVVAAGGNVVLVNEAWSRSVHSGEISAATSDVGANYLQAVQHSSLARAEEVVAGVRAVLARQADRFTFEYPYQSKTQERWFYMSVIACDISGSRHAVIAHRAIPALPKYRSSHDLSEGLPRLLDSAAHIVWSATADGHLAYFNTAWHELVGSDVGEDVAATLVSKLHAEDRQRWCEQWQSALESGQPYEIEYRLLVPDEPARWYLESGAPVRASHGGEIESWLMLATRIDNHKRREAELHEMVHRRDEFFATLLHELRNPLAPIASALDLLGVDVHDATRVSAACGIIQRQLRQLTHLVDDLLDVSRITRGHVELQRRTVDLAEVVTVAVEAARPVIRMRAHELTLEAPPRPVSLEADPVRLAQVLTNLLINAAKYTHPGGHIALSTLADESGAAICVRDDGIGIAAEKLLEIFELFSRVAPASPASGGGLGVGLAVSKQLVELHGGSIAARSAGIGKGSEFTVRLPVGNGAVKSV
jgi:signal transduction histidine kinase